MYLTKVPSLLKSFYSKAIWSSENDPRLQLTFDDGPHAESTLELLQLLDRKELKATFFCLGRLAEKHPELIEAIKDAGHLLGYHGYDHLSGWKTNKSAYLDNLHKNIQLYPSKLFRPPYGRISPSQYNAINRELGLDVVFWTHMPGDFDTKVNEQDLTSRIYSAYKFDSVIVLHDNPMCLSRNYRALSML